MRIKKRLLGLLCAAFLAFCAPVFAAGEQIILSPPDKAGGKPLMQVLQERKSSRSFSSRELLPETLSNLLWAANGVNRPDGKRTAPSAGGTFGIEIYVATAKGLYLYDPVAHALNPISEEDIREDTGMQDFTQTAPVNLIYVANLDRLSRYPDALRELYAAMDTAFVSQNVYLFCASEGLATVVLGWVDKEALAQKMGLKEGQKVILTQPVGY